MAGADVFTMEPDSVHRAVEVLFDVEGEVDRQTLTVADQTAEAAETLKSANTALGAALAETGEWWKIHRAGGFTSLVGNTGEYLATCAEEAVEVDEYNAGAFASFADSDRYPGRDNANASSRPDW
ncbi:hypothetical protein [Glycomyces buryatensis]|uniref:WXG100 family type VII secretion target n=1 Tax=Glycomyces buryatensis TaxID=2570927 RepID=A0A4S8QD18_9ACTN|nr:hypothetical protein [Glycomyces buryatensis]THV42423.1 hypothetical protein FAB82_07150 [Glycomyces buryatensis]